jgi:dolichol-phosphate mannosyltransferase
VLQATRPRFPMRVNILESGRQSSEPTSSIAAELHHEVRIQHLRSHGHPRAAWLAQSLAGRIFMGDKLGLVIPTLNEEENIGTLLDTVRLSLDGLPIDYELIVVDDNSTDSTGAVVQRYSQSDPRIRLLVRVGSRGLAGAVIYGWKHTNANLLGVIDADLQHPPALLPALLSAIEQGRDIAIASRYSAGNGTPGWNPLRRAVSVLSTWTTLPLQKASIRVRDPLSGFFMMRRAVITGVSLQPEGFKLLLEILVRGNIKSAAEVPYHFGHRYGGKSKANLRVGLDYLVLLGRLSRSAFTRPGA